MTFLWYADVFWYKRRGYSISGLFWVAFFPSASSNRDAICAFLWYRKSWRSRRHRKLFSCCSVCRVSGSNPEDQIRGLTELFPDEKRFLHNVFYTQILAVHGCVALTHLDALTSPRRGCTHRSGVPILQRTPPKSVPEFRSKWLFHRSNLNQRVFCAGLLVLPEISSRTILLECPVFKLRSCCLRRNWSSDNNRKHALSIQRSKWLCLPVPELIVKQNPW